MNKKKNRKILLSSVVVLGALFYLVYGGMQEAVVYFQTPEEIKQNPDNLQGKFLRIGGQVVPGSLSVDQKQLKYLFDISDGEETIRVRFQGIPPDLFREGQGAVIEGKLASDGTFAAATIFAKHAEEYQPAEPGDKDYSRSFVPSAGEKRP